MYYMQFVKGSSNGKPRIANSPFITPADYDNGVVKTAEANGLTEGKLGQLGVMNTGKNLGEGRAENTFT